MKFKSIEKKYPGKYLSYYIASYETSDNSIKNYEFISRNKNLTAENFGKNKAVGVGIVPFSSDGKRILIQQEFRMPCNCFVYQFPTGLIDNGETIEEAATRELLEETGVHVDEVIEVLSPSYSSAPTSDEIMVTIVVKASGEIKNSTFVDEEIIAKWYTKDEIKKLFENGAMMSARTQLFLWKWMNE